jgi:hypothetical protein
MTTAPAVPVRAVSVRQPWAWAIARGWKPVENRTRAFPATLTGAPVALYAALTWDEAMLAALAATIGTDPHTRVFPVPDATEALIGALRDGDPLLRACGAVIAVVTFTGSHKSYGAPGTGRDCPGTRHGLCSPWSEPGARHWQVSGARPLTTPVPCRGMPGFWPLPADTTTAITAQLTALPEEP